MKAIGMIRGESGVTELEIPRPKITAADDVLIKVREVGLDGTDFGILAKNRPDIAPGADYMVLGHEMTGRIEAVGPAVTTLKPGDLVTVTVRRGCGICHPCLENQSDMCMTGLYTERGIHKLDGFLSEYVVDREQYVVKVPDDCTDMAVLSEPISIVEKGIEQIRLIQSRLPWNCVHPEHTFDSPLWGGCKLAMVIGAGPLGLMAAALLRLAGASVVVTDIVNDNHPKARLAGYLEAQYINVRGLTAEQIMEQSLIKGERLDIIFEASGASAMALELVNFMSRSSIYVMTGIPQKEQKVDIDAAAIVRQMVRFNQVIVGSVNSNRHHFESVMKSIPLLKERFPELRNRVLTDRFGFNDYREAFNRRNAESIKTYISLEKEFQSNS
ncbi:Alcohol dehydrogenase GroES domain protein [Dehalogenimonas lykanthroporepellens BL-DC-9]|nr:Alcohol dehydrogenase GroES domain protein [Dehalogenimonas lykanthroporepellens BL-DC-9]